MKKFPIGILSGRVIPNDYDLYQAFPVEWKRDALEARALGFDFIELVYDRKGELMQLIDEGVNEWELEFRSLCVAALTEIPLRQEEKRNQILKEALQVASFFRISLVVIPLLEMHAPAGLEELRAVLKEIDSSCRKYHLEGRVALESDFSTRELISEIEALGMQNRIGICLDTGNVRSMGRDPGLEILSASTHLFHVHLKDRKVHGANCRPGTGDVDFKKVFTQLRASHYQGLLALETPYGGDARVSAQENLRFFRGAEGS